VSAAASPVELLERSLHQGSLYVRTEDGERVALAVDRWLGPLSGADERVLDAAVGPVLDVGCGPGRHVLALAQRRVSAIGVDIAPAAVRRARDRGAAVILGSIFDPVPGPGRWRTALLLDGNIGIGGRPAALLARLRELLSPSGRILCELEPPGFASRCELLALEDAAGARSSWFAWARVSVDEIEGIAGRTGFSTRYTWSDGDRWFAHLTRDAPAGAMRFGWRAREAAR
jgi:SAM-dependent methyltransferase